VKVALPFRNASGSVQQVGWSFLAQCADAAAAAVAAAAIGKAGKQRLCPSTLGGVGGSVASGGGGAGGEYEWTLARCVEGAAPGGILPVDTAAALADIPTPRLNALLTGLHERALADTRTHGGGDRPSDAGGRGDGRGALPMNTSRFLSECLHVVSCHST